MQQSPSFRRSLLLGVALAGAFAGQALAQIVAASPSAAAAAHSDASAIAPDQAAAPVPRALSGALSAYLRARFAAEHGAFALAFQDFQTALPGDPADPVVLQQAFLAGVMSGAPGTADLARKLPDNQIAQLVLADLDATAGNWDAAERRFVHLPNQALTQLLQPLLVAWAQQGAGRTDDALATLSAAMRTPRPNGIYALHAGMIADLAGRTGDADRFYGMAQSAGGGLNLRESQILASWQARQGRRGVAAATIQSVGAAGAELALAVPALERSVAARPVERATDGIAEAYLALAGALRQQDAGDYALLLLHMSLDLRPDFTAARLMMADTQAQLGETDTALATLQAVPANDPLAAVVAFRRAVLTGSAGRTDDAIHMLDTLAHAYPQRSEPLQALGDLLRQRHRWTEAVPAYTRALARMPHPGPQNWGIYFNRGAAYDRAHQWPKAEADLNRALELAPNQPVVLNYLGYAWTEQGHNLDRARQMLEKAVSLQPNDGNIVDSLGWVLLRQGDGAGAVRELERAVEMEPVDSTINGHLGDAYWQTGRRLEAQYQWRRALDLNPEPEDVPKLEAKLRDAVSAAMARQGAAVSEHPVR